jgi:hypothetical protein
MGWTLGRDCPLSRLNFTAPRILIPSCDQKWQTEQYPKLTDRHRASAANQCRGGNLILEFLSHTEMFRSLDSAAVAAERSKPKTNLTATMSLVSMRRISAIVKTCAAREKR